MRDVTRPQRDLFVQYPVHQLAQELRQVAAILDRHPEFAEWVHVDLTREKKKFGDNGMSADQILRSAILKNIRGVSYQELAFDLQDSTSTKAFVGLAHNEWYSASCLQSNVSRIGEMTWEQIQVELLRDARISGMEDGKRVRIDSTAVESHIHHPTDSSLLYDSLRVLQREFKNLRKAADKPHWRFSIPIKEVKSLVFKINNSKNDDERLPHYKKLLKIAARALKDITELLPKLQSAQSLGLSQVEKFNEVSGYLAKIINQTEKRVIRGRTVPVEQKIVSIFEPHTDILVKDRRDTYFGHKVFLTSGASNLILDCQIPRGNPADSDMFMECLNKASEAIGRVPLQTSTDGGFSSQENVKQAKEKGVRDVCFSKPIGMKISDMVKSAWVFEKLRNWRAGIEGVISFLKRGFGLDRCDWRGFDGFCRYVKSAVVAFNLVVMARHELA
jgi:transposase, IS5 family